MTGYRDEIDGLDASADALGDSASAAATLLGSFNSELQRFGATVQATGADVVGLERGLSRGLRRAFDGVIFKGDSLSDALTNLASSVSRTVYAAAARPVANHFGGVLAEGVSGLVGGLLGFADGGAFSQGRVMPFANGGIVSQATAFPMRGGTGLMGEAGPEAIMPLARGPDGKLGVQAGGGRGTTVVMNISTPDAASFQRSQSQIAAQMGRALRRGERNR